MEPTQALDFVAILPSSSTILLGIGAVATLAMGVALAIKGFLIVKKLWNKV